MAEFLEDEQGTPPLPNGYEAISKTDSSVPPLPKGYALLKKKNLRNRLLLLKVEVGVRHRQMVLRFFQKLNPLLN